MMDFNQDLGGLIWQGEDLDQHYCKVGLKHFNDAARSQNEWIEYFNIEKKYRLATAFDIMSYLRSTRDDEELNDAAKAVSANWLKEALKNEVITGTWVEHKSEALCAIWHKGVMKFPLMGGHDIKFKPGTIEIPSTERKFDLPLEDRSYLTELFALHPKEDQTVGLVSGFTRTNPAMRIHNMSSPSMACIPTDRAVMLRINKHDNILEAHTYISPEHYKALALGVRK